MAVEDEGRGIPESQRSRIFQPFFTTKPHGTGLGLFVCRQIVEELGGSLSYESEVGRGSKFTVRLRAEHHEPLLLATGSPRSVAP
jgi:signal transduction histidine kinase